MEIHGRGPAAGKDLFVRDSVRGLSYASGFKREILTHLAQLQSPDIKEESLAQVLLDNPGTAIYYIGREGLTLPSWMDNPTEEDKYIRPLLLGVNYTYAHSDAWYTIAVQNVVDRIGPYTLRKPPESDETTFYLESVEMPGIYVAKFLDEVANIGKLKGQLYFTGDPKKIFSDFSALGYTFVEHPRNQNW
jgi:hypothetical protein